MKFLRISAILALGLTFLNIKPSETIFLPQHKLFENVESAKKAFSANKPTVYFDIHEVLAKKDRFFFLWNGIKQIQYKVRFASGLGSALTDFSLLNEIWKRATAQDKSKITEEYFDLVAKDHPGLATMLMKFANDIYGPMPGINPLLDKIKDAGCQFELLSNIGPRMLKDFRKRPEVSDTFKYFDGKLNTINRVHPDDDGGRGYWIWKRQMTAYLGALECTNKTLYNNLIFIDDKLKNVTESTKYGFTGILFKSPEQLEKDLHALGVI